MERYKYKAISDQGRSVRGVISAKSEGDLNNQLQSAGLELIDCRPLTAKSSFLSGSSFLNKVKIRDLIQFFLHMEQMQSSGVPLLDALGDIRDTTENAKLRDIMSEIHRDVYEGASLSEAMAKHPKVFGALFISIIKSGEETGDLTSSYRQLIKYLKWIDQMQSKVRKATRYPIIVLCVVILVIVVMMGYVVPQIVDFLTNMKIELPFYSVALIETSKFFQFYWWIILAVPIAILLLIKILSNLSDSFKYRIDSIKLGLPIMGPLLRKIMIARYSQTFGALFASGIDIISALKWARQTVTNLVLADALDRVERYIQAGQPISQAFNTSGEFPSMVVRMLKIGEESGNLTAVLDQVAEFYSKDVDEAVEKLIAMIEPGLTAVLGLMILWIAAGVFGPIYSSFENIKF